MRRTNASDVNLGALYCGLLSSGLRSSAACGLLEELEIHCARWTVKGCALNLDVELFWRRACRVSARTSGFVVAISSVNDIQRDLSRSVLYEKNEFDGERHLISLSEETSARAETSTVRSRIAWLKIVIH